MVHLASRPVLPNSTRAGLRAHLVENDGVSLAELMPLLYVTLWKAADSSAAS